MCENCEKVLKSGERVGGKMSGAVRRCELIKINIKACQGFRRGGGRGAGYAGYQISLTVRRR